MTRDDIIRMARKYGCVIAEDGPDCQFEVSFHADQIIAMVRAAQAAEREACAKVCEDTDIVEFQHCMVLHEDAAKTLRNAAAAIRAALTERQTCVWQQDGDSDSGIYGTSCGHYFAITDGTPKDNEMQWCCYCGKKLMQELITEDEDD